MEHTTIIPSLSLHILACFIQQQLTKSKIKYIIWYKNKIQIKTGQNPVMFFLVFFFLSSPLTQITQYISHLSQKYTANKEEKKNSHIGKETNPGEVYIRRPQPVAEAYELRDPGCAERLEAWQAKVSSRQCVFSLSLSMRFIHTPVFTKPSPARVQPSWALLSNTD